MSEDAIEKRFEDLRKTAEKYAVAHGQAGHLDEFKKSKLAILMKKYEKDGFATSAAQEREARADPDYIKLLDGLHVANVESERLRWELKLAEMKIDVWRTQQSNKRAEMNLR